MQPVLLKAISNHKKRNKKSDDEQPKCSWWPVAGGTSQGLIFNTRPNISQDFFINNLHGEQGNPQFTDDTEMGQNTLFLSPSAQGEGDAPVHCSDPGRS